jgi:hypothetical protein
MEAHSMRFIHAAVVIPMFLLLASGPRTAAAAPPTKPCSQVTAAQVSTALGETVAAGQKSNSVTCAWIADNPKHQVVSLMYSPPGDWDKRKRPMPGVTKTNVPGIGDDAMAETAANFTTLYVKKGTTTFMVRVYGVADPARQLAIEQPIAQAVAAKL